MMRLIKARLLKYFNSPFLLIALLCCFISGTIQGIHMFRSIKTLLEIEPDAAMLSSFMSDDFFKIVSWVVIVLVSLDTGREFSDGTIRNKMYIGHSKTAVYFSEMISGSVIAVIAYISFMLPVLIGGNYFFLTLSPINCFLLLLELLLFFLVWCFFSVTVTMLIANRAFGVVTAFSVMLFFAVANSNLRGYYYNTEPSQITATMIELSEDGEPYQVEKMIQNHWYIEGIPKVLVNIEHEVDPFSRSYDVCIYSCIHNQEKADAEDLEWQSVQDRQVKYDSLVLLVTSLILILGGCVLFRKKDLK